LSYSAPSNFPFGAFPQQGVILASALAAWLSVFKAHRDTWERAEHGRPKPFLLIEAAKETSMPEGV